MNDQPILLRAEEAANLLSLGRSKVFALMASGELPSIHIGRAVRVPREGLERWVRERLADDGSRLTLPGKSG
jgi:excisionase family DNA binding protein